MGKDNVQVAMLTIAVAVRGNGAVMQPLAAHVMTNYEDWDFWQQTALRALTDQIRQALQAPTEAQDDE